MDDIISLNTLEVRDLIPALVNEIDTWKNADCGDSQASNDAWVSELGKLLDRLRNA